MNEANSGTNHRVYRIFQCPRCKKMTWDANGKRRGLCSAGVKKVEVIEDEQYDLKHSAPLCKDWIKGKPINQLKRTINDRK